MYGLGRRWAFLRSRMCFTGLNCPHFYCLAPGASLEGRVLEDLYHSFLGHEMNKLTFAIGDGSEYIHFIHNSSLWKQVFLDLERRSQEGHCYHKSPNSDRSLFLWILR